MTLNKYTYQVGKNMWMISKEHTHAEKGGFEDLLGRNASALDCGID